MYSPKSVAVSASSRVPSNECICRRCVCAELLAVARAHAQPPRAQDYLWYNALSSKALPHSTDGSVVEFSPATREARVRFPVSATFFFFFFLPNPSSFFFSLLLAQRFSPLPRMILLESVQFFLFTFLLFYDFLCLFVNYNLWPHSYTKQKFVPKDGIFDFTWGIIIYDITYPDIHASCPEFCYSTNSKCTDTCWISLWKVTSNYQLFFYW